MEAWQHSKNSNDAGFVFIWWGSLPNPKICNPADSISQKNLSKEGHIRSLQNSFPKFQSPTKHHWNSYWVVLAVKTRVPLTESVTKFKSLNVYWGIFFWSFLNLTLLTYPALWEKIEILLGLYEFESYFNHLETWFTILEGCPIV